MKNFREASNYACDQVEGRIVEGKLNFPPLTFADFVAFSAPDIKIDSGGPGFSYNVSNPFATKLIQLAVDNYQFFDLCVKICTTAIDSGKSLPEALKHFAIRVLDGKFKRPTPPNRPRKKDFFEKNFLFILVSDVAQRFQLSLTRNDVSGAISACDAVADALTVCGRKTRYVELKNLMTHRDSAQVRLEIEIAGKLMLRSETEEYPYNILHPDTYHAQSISADATVLDIRKTFPPVQGKRP